MYQPIDPVVLNNFSYLQQYLTREEQLTPNSEVRMMDSCVLVIEAILDGKLVLCTEQPDLPEPAPAEETPEDTGSEPPDEVESE